jgi:signal transduction histidine kinase
VLLIHEDVTDRLALERSYNTLIEVQRDTLDNLGEGIAVFGGDGRLRLFNPAFVKLWELTDPQLEGSPRLANIAEAFRHLLGGDDWQVLHQQMIAGLEDRKPRAGRFTRSDTKVVDFVALPLPDGGVLFRFADISDSVRVQRALIERNEALETADRLKTEFLANISYELRTPLTTIRGYAELYRQGALGEDRLPNAMRRIEQEAERMSRLVAELLELARLDRTSSLDLTDTDLTGLVTDAVADALAVEPERPVRTELPRSPLVVTADEPRLRQVLANLLGNIREHTAPGTPVAVRLSAAGQGALLEVTDSGQGMDAEAAARAFDRFYRGGHNGKDGHGSGLGLSIVQAIAAAHGGHAMLRSAVGVGTSVQVWIPFQPPAQVSERMPPPGLAGN